MHLYRRSSHDSLFSSIMCQWRFAFLSLGRPEYLEDTEVLSTRFQVLSLSLSEKEILRFIFMLSLIKCNFWSHLMTTVSDFTRGGMSMGLGSSILDWNILIMLQKGLMQSIR